MGYTDSKGRPEIIAQPFIAKGTTEWRVIEEPDDAGADSDETAGNGEQ
ncbi:MAG: hypothetical protein ACRDS9_12405 [Pseudonocardiaceae bacterium]